MGYFKNVGTDIIEDWLHGDSIGEIARHYNISIKDVVMIVSQEDEELIDILKGGTGLTAGAFTFFVGGTMSGWHNARIAKNIEDSLNDFIRAVHEADGQIYLTSKYKDDFCIPLPEDIMLTYWTASTEGSDWSVIMEDDLNV